MSSFVSAVSLVVGALGGCRSGGAGTINQSPAQFCASLIAEDYGTAQRALQREHARAVKAAAIPADASPEIETKAAVEAMITVLEAQSCVRGAEMGVGVVRTDPPIKKFFFSAPERTSCEGQFFLARPFPIELSCHRFIDPMPRAPRR